MISVLATRNNQRLGDLAAGTLVIRDAKREGDAPPPLPAMSPRATRAGTSAASGRSRRAPCARSSSAARSCSPGARHALAEQLAGQLRPRVAGARAGLDDETFLEHLAAAKARGKLREIAEEG